MFIEESGADLTVTVEGEEYHAEAAVDIDSDGVDDTVVVETDDGAIAFTDTDADGQADLMTQLDADGDIVGQARFDEASGDWVSVEPRDPADPEGSDEQTAGSDSGPMTADTPQGQVEVGVPTHDTDGDGVNDSVVVQDSDGDTVIFTDIDQDGDADFATEITGEGDVTVSENTGDGDWTVIERGHLDEDGRYQRDSLTEEAAAEESGWVGAREPDADEVRVDPRTGGWVRG
ncbi:MAG TPA: DUF6802 family protein [Pseudonocardiaceae bacterium]